jgi:hypothetical protein
MRLDLYQAETARIASEQSALLDEARQRLLNLSPCRRWNRMAFCMRCKC